MDNHALFHKELWDWLLKMAGEDDPLGNLMKSAIEEVNNRYTSVESSEIKEETFRDTLPGYDFTQDLTFVVLILINSADAFVLVMACEIACARAAKNPF